MFSDLSYHCECFEIVSQVKLHIEISTALINDIFIDIGNQQDRFVLIRTRP